MCDVIESEFAQFARIVYFSSVSENTHRFVQKLNLSAVRIPLSLKEEIFVDTPYFLITPTYGSGEPDKAVPKQVIKFLNNKKNRDLLLGVIGSGNTNFGVDYCLAGDIVAQKCRVAHIYRFELLGTPEDVNIVSERLEEVWNQKKVI